MNRYKKFRVATAYFEQKKLVDPACTLERTSPAAAWRISRRAAVWKIWREVLTEV